MLKFLVVLVILALGVSAMAETRPPRSFRGRPHPRLHHDNDEPDSDESASEAVESETDESIEDDCTEIPDELDLETVCWNVQQWIKANEAYETDTLEGCDDTDPLAVAKSLMRPEDACFLDWPAPSHLDEEDDSEEEEETSEDAELLEVSAVEARLSKKVSTTLATKAVRMCRDEFITRIEAVLRCEIRVIDYCHPPHFMKSREECDFTSDCDECDDEAGCQWDDDHSICIPSCGGDLPCGTNDPWELRSYKSHPSTQILENTVQAHEIDDFDPLDCADIDSEDHCEAHSICQWTEGSDEDDEDDHCSPCVDNFPDPVVSPCADIDECDACRESGVCEWNDAELVCVPQSSEITTVDSIDA